MRQAVRDLLAAWGRGSGTQEGHFSPSGREVGRARASGNDVDVAAFAAITTADDATGSSSATGR